MADDSHSAILRLERVSIYEYVGKARDLHGAVGPQLRRIARSQVGQGCENLVIDRASGRIVAFSRVETEEGDPCPVTM